MRQILLTWSFPVTFFISILLTSSILTFYGPHENYLSLTSTGLISVLMGNVQSHHILDSITNLNGTANTGNSLTSTKLILALMHG